MAKFKEGDRVVIKGLNYTLSCGGKLHNGSVGTVVESSNLYPRVAWDDFYWDAHENGWYGVDIKHLELVQDVDDGVKYWKYLGKIGNRVADNFTIGKIYQTDEYGQVTSDDGVTYEGGDDGRWLPNGENLKKFYNFEQSTKEEYLSQNKQTKLEEMEAQYKAYYSEINKKKRVYLSGKISDTYDYLDRFKNAQDFLESMGYEVVNPALLNSNLPKSCTWVDYMKLSYAYLDLCDAIYMLDGWKDSRGARLELEYAENFKKEVMGFYE